MRGARKGKGGPRAPDWPDLMGYFCVLARDAVSGGGPFRGVLEVTIYGRSRSSFSGTRNNM